MKAFFSLVLSFFFPRRVDVVVFAHQFQVGVFFRDVKFMNVSDVKVSDEKMRNRLSKFE